MEITILKHIKKEFTTTISIQSDDSDKMIFNIIDAIESVLNKTLRVDEKRKSFYILEIPTKDSDTTLLKILKLFRNNSWNILTSNCFESLPLNSLVNTIETTFFLEYLIHHNNHINYNEKKSEIPYEKISAESRRRSSIGSSNYMPNSSIDNLVNKPIMFTNNDNTLQDQDQINNASKAQNNTTGVGMTVTTGKLYQKFLNRRASLTKSQVDQPPTSSINNNDNFSSENRDISFNSPIPSTNIASIESKQDKTKSISVTNLTSVSEDSHPLAEDASQIRNNNNDATHIPTSSAASTVKTSNTSKIIANSKQPTVELTTQVKHTALDVTKRPVVSHIVTETRRPSTTSDTTDEVKNKRPSGSWIKHENNVNTSPPINNVASLSLSTTTTTTTTTTPSAASKLLQSTTDDDTAGGGGDELVKSAVNPLSAQSIYKSRHTEPIQKDQHEVEKINHFSKLGSAFLNGNSLQKKGGPGRGLGKSI